MRIAQRALRTGLLASAVLAGASIIAFTVPATTQAAATNAESRPHIAAAATLLGAACGFGPAPHLSGETGHTVSDGVNIRSGTSTSECTPPVATINKSDLLRYQCWTQGENGTWTYLQDASIGKWGYIRNDKLANGGSRVRCDF